MKKFFLMAAFAAMLVPFTACNKKDGVRAQIPAASNSANAKKVELSIPAPVKDGKSITSFEFTDGGRYILSLVETKASDETYETGSYTFANGVYTLEGFGTIAIDGNNVTITATGEAAVQTTGTVADTSNNLSEMAQTWSVDKIDVSINTGNGNIGFVKNGCDLEEIATEIIAQAEKMGVKVEIDLGQFKGATIKYVSFSSSKTIMVEFTNGLVFVGDLSGVITDAEAYAFHYELKNEGNDLINASADCRFIPKSDKTAYFTVNVDLDNDNKGRVMFIMTKIS